MRSENKTMTQQLEKRKSINQKMNQQSNKVFVGGIPIEVTQEQLRDYMAQFGEVVFTKILQKQNKSRGFGFVTFKSQEVAEKVVAIDHFFEGKRFECKPVVNDKVAKRQALEQKYKKVFLGGMHKSITEQQLSDRFGKYGKLLRAVVNRTHKGNLSRGSGFLLFEDPEVAAMVIKEGQVKVERYIVTCQPCLLRDEIIDNSSSQEANKAQDLLTGLQSSQQPQMTALNQQASNLPPLSQQQIFQEGLNQGYQNQLGPYGHQTPQLHQSYSHPQPYQPGIGYPGRQDLSYYPPGQFDQCLQVQASQRQHHPFENQASKQGLGLYPPVYPQYMPYQYGQPGVSSFQGPPQQYPSMAQGMYQNQPNYPQPQHFQAYPMPPQNSGMIQGQQSQVPYSQQGMAHQMLQNDRASQGINQVPQGYLSQQGKYHPSYYIGPQAQFGQKGPVNVQKGSYGEQSTMPHSGVDHQLQPGPLNQGGQMRSQGFFGNKQLSSLDFGSSQKYRQQDLNTNIEIQQVKYSLENLVNEKQSRDLLKKQQQQKD